MFIILLPTLFLPLFSFLETLLDMSFIHLMHLYFKLIEGGEENNSCINIVLKLIK
jgi:hypothetical protein